MKKIVSIILIAMMLLTPVISLAAPTLDARNRLSGFFFRETISLCDQYTITVPEGLFLDDEEREENGVLRLYADDMMEKQFVVIAAEDRTEMDGIHMSYSGFFHPMEEQGAMQLHLSDRTEKIIDGDYLLYRLADDEKVSFLLFIDAEGPTAT